jgi:hypothetical protein
MTSNEQLDLVSVLGDGVPLQLSQVEALGLQSLLASERIEAVVSGYWAEPVIPFRILVSSARAEEAARIIAEARAGGEAAAIEAELAGEAAGDVPPDDVHCGREGVF